MDRAGHEISLQPRWGKVAAHLGPTEPQIGKASNEENCQCGEDAHEEVLHDLVFLRSGCDGIHESLCLWGNLAICWRRKLCPRRLRHGRKLKGVNGRSGSLQGKGNFESA